MCQLCTKIASDKNSTLKQNLDKIADAIYHATTDKEKRHLLELSNKIIDEAMPFSKPDEDLDKIWQDENS